MRKRFKIIRLLLKLTLFFQIYSYHGFKAEATKNNFPESVYQDTVGEETVLNDQISDKNTGLSVVVERQKRPVRLIPLKILR